MVTRKKRKKPAAKKSIPVRFHVYIWQSSDSFWRITIRTRNGRNIGPTEGFSRERKASDDVFLLYAMTAENTRMVFGKPKDMP